MEQLPRWLKKIKPVKSLVYGIAGASTYGGLSIINKLRIEGTEVIKNLPNKNVLFVSNHQTYFKDVIALMHVFGAARVGYKTKLGTPLYLLRPFTDLYFVAAEETMNSSIIAKALKLGGAITVSRTWRKDGVNTKQERNEDDTKKIDDALAESWVLTFPQGTTTPYAPGRKGTAYIVKNNKPIVVPIVIDGFSDAFTKRGLSFKKRGTKLTIKFKEPLSINYDDDVDSILEQIMDSIEQSEKFRK